MLRTPTRTYAPAAFWVLFCAYFNLVGWTLSALHQLNKVGYALALIIGAAALVVTGRQYLFDPSRFWNWQKLKRRYSKPLPLAFALLTFLAVLGGALHAPSNYDALAYRVPRVLHWLADGQWHWIHTEFNRLNTRAPCTEWVSAPLILFTGTDRFLFLVNVLSYLLLPGLLFSLLTRLGVRSRAAWHWMWVIPTGYCYILQVGGIGNDLFGTIFPLAAVDFALRARQSWRVGEVWLSILAAALMTSSKSSNLPLLLPWLVAVAPTLKLLCFGGKSAVAGKVTEMGQTMCIAQHPGAQEGRAAAFQAVTAAVTLAVVVTAAFASLLPQMALNTRYSGEWTGTVAERNQGYHGNPLLLAGNNSVLMVIQNLSPPVFPFKEKWERIVRQVQGPALRSKLEEAFEPEGAHWGLGEIQIEEGAGLGFGLTTLLLASWAAAMIKRDGPGGSSRWRFTVSGAIIASAFIALAAVMAKSFMTTFARMVSPYYCLLIPALLLGQNQVRIVRSSWWKWSAGVVFALAALLLVISPARPLWPPGTILQEINLGSHPSLQRAAQVYSVYAMRNDVMAPVRPLIPAGTKVVGLVSFDDPEASLWRPFFHWRVEHVTKSDTAQDLRARGIRYVLVNVPKLRWLFEKPFQSWLAEMDGEVVETFDLPVRTTSQPGDWALVKLR